MNRLKPGFFSEFKRSTVLQTLKRCPLLAEISPEDLNAVVELSAVKTVAAGEFLFRESGTVRGF